MLYVPKPSLPFDVQLRLSCRLRPQLRRRAGIWVAALQRVPEGPWGPETEARPRRRSMKLLQNTKARQQQRCVTFCGHSITPPPPPRAALKGLLCSAVPHQHSRSDGNSSSSSQSTHLFQQELDAGDVFLHAGIHEWSQSVFVLNL